MKAKTILFFFCLTWLVVACEEKAKDNAKPKESQTTSYKFKGDSTIYGLACEGCNDSTIVLLPMDGSDPVRYDVIDAHRNGRVVGDIQIGDWIGVVANKQDKHMADEVINLDEIKGIWCYVVMPKMRDYEKKIAEENDARYTRFYKANLSHSTRIWLLVASTMDGTKRGLCQRTIFFRARKPCSLSAIRLLYGLAYMEWEARYRKRHTTI